MPLFLPMGLVNNIIKYMDSLFSGYINNWCQIFNWSGRTSRKSFWSFLSLTLFALLFLVLFLVYFATGAMAFGVFFLILALGTATILALLSAAIRRMNDIGKPQYYVLIPLYNIILLFKRGRVEDFDAYSNIEEKFQFKLKYIGIITIGTILLFVILVCCIILEDILYVNDFINVPYYDRIRRIYLLLFHIIILPPLYILTSIIALKLVNPKNDRVVYYTCMAAFAIMIVIYSIAMFF
jgi:uncharacterized membrane protein YhaH (DUF805 family)